MMLKIARILPICCVYLSVLLSGCATTNQILPITPQINLTDVSLQGTGRTMQLVVRDLRKTTFVGYRDAADSKTKIVSSPEALGRIQHALESAYTDLGFTIVDGGETADINLEVDLTELSYAREQTGVVKNLRTGATLTAKSIMSDRTVSATYRDGQGKDTIVKPSLSSNADILNAHLNAALLKLISDPRLTFDNW